MNKRQLHNVQSVKLYFKQWKNKSFAAFCSMGKVVHIGCLSVSVAQWIGKLIELVDEIVQLSESRENDDEEVCLKEQELLQVLPVEVTADVICGRSIDNKLKYELPLIGCISD